MNRRLLVAALVVAVLASLALWWRGSLRARRPAPAPADTAAATGVQAVRLYFAAPDGGGLAPESRELVRSDDLHQRVAQLVAELNAGPRGRGIAVLPPGTGLRQVFLDPEGLLTVDLSPAFRSGFRGGSTAEVLAVASLVRTLSQNLPEAKRVLLLCGGRPLDTLGGHIPLDQPLDPAEWP